MTKLHANPHSFTLLAALCAASTLAAQVGVNNADPEQALDVGGKVKIADDAEAPSEGTLRYNAAEGDFEGYTDEGWEDLNGAPESNPTGVQTRLLRMWNLPPDGEYYILGDRANEPQVGSTEIFMQDGSFTSELRVPQGKVLLVDNIVVTGLGGANDLFDVRIAETDERPGSQVFPNNPIHYLAGTTAGGPAQSSANHMPLLVVRSGKSVCVSNNARSTQNVWVTVYGILVDDTDEYFRL